MKHHQESSGIRHLLATVAVTAVLVTAAIGLSQCRMTNDSVTGVDLDRTDSGFHHSERSSKCEQRCKKDFEKAREQEDKRHKQAIKDCEKYHHSHDGKDEDKKDGDSEKQCKKEEKALHRQNVKDLEDAKRACKAECRYREGSGKGGD